jgi:hypothetical protein
MRVKSSNKISKSNTGGGVKRKVKISSSQAEAVKAALGKFDTSTFLNNSQKNEIISTLSKAGISPLKSFAEALKEYGFDSKQIENLFKVIRGESEEIKKNQTNNNLTISQNRISAIQNNSFNNVLSLKNSDINSVVNSIDNLSHKVKENLKSELEKISENKNISETEKKDAFYEVLDKTLKKYNEEIRSGMIFSSYA